MNVWLINFPLIVIAVVIGWQMGQRWERAQKRAGSRPREFLNGTKNTERKP